MFLVSEHRVYDKTARL